jgi:hypothetical protein
MTAGDGIDASELTGAGVNTGRGWIAGETTAIGRGGGDADATGGRAGLDSASGAVAGVTSTAGGLGNGTTDETWEVSGAFCRPISFPVITPRKNTTPDRPTNAATTTKMPPALSSNRICPHLTSARAR